MGNLLIFQTHCSSLGPSSEPLAQCTFRQPEVWRSHQQRAARYQVLTQLADTDTTGTCLEICSLCDVPVPKWVLCIFWQFWIFLFKENTTLATVISPFWDFTVVPPSLPSVVSEISFVSFESMLLFQYHIWEPTFLHFFLFQMGFCRFCFWKLTWWCHVRSSAFTGHIICFWEPSGLVSFVWSGEYHLVAQISPNLLNCLSHARRSVWEWRMCGWQSKSAQMLGHLLPLLYLWVS